MADAVPVTEITLDQDDQEDGELDPFTVSSFWIEATSAIIMLVGLLGAWGFLRSWFSTSDRIVASVLIAFGLIFALARAKWRGLNNPWRVPAASILWGVSIVLLLIGMLIGGESASYAMIFAIGLAFAAWVSIRVRGESFFFALSIGFAISAPAIIEQIISWGGVRLVGMECSDDYDRLSGCYWSIEHTRRKRPGNLF